MISESKKERAVKAAAAIAGVIALWCLILVAYDLISESVDPTAQSFAVLKLGIASLPVLATAGIAAFVFARGSAGWKQLWSFVVDTAAGQLLVAGIALLNAATLVNRMITSGELLANTLPAVFWAFYGVHWFRNGLKLRSQARSQSSKGPDAEAIP